MKSKSNRKHCQSWKCLQKCCHLHSGSIIWTSVGLLVIVPLRTYLRKSLITMKMVIVIIMMMIATGMVMAMRLSATMAMTIMAAKTAMVIIINGIVMIVIMIILIIITITTMADNKNSDIDHNVSHIACFSSYIISKHPENWSYQCISYACTNHACHAHLYYVGKRISLNHSIAFLKLLNDIWNNFITDLACQCSSMWYLQW